MKLFLCIALTLVVGTGVALGSTLEAYRLHQKSRGVSQDSVRADRRSPTRDQEALKRELRMISREEVPGKRQWERKKSAKLAMVSAMAMPGLGQLYNGRRFKTIIMVGLSTFYMSKIWIEHKNAQRRKKTRDLFPVNSTEWNFENLWHNFHKDQSRDYAWWSGAIWLIGVLDAYVDAHLHDVRAYRPSKDGPTGGAGFITFTIRF